MKIWDMPSEQENRYNIYCEECGYVETVDCDWVEEAIVAHAENEHGES